MRRMIAIPVGRNILIPAGLAAVVLLAVLSVHSGQTEGGPDDGTRVLPDLPVSSSETVKDGSGGETTPDSEETLTPEEDDTGTADSDHRLEAASSETLPASGVETGGTGVESGETAERDADSPPQADRTSGSENKSGIKSEGSTKSDNSAKPENSTKPDNNTKPENSTKSDNNARPENSTKPDNNTRPENSTKPDNNAKPENGTKPDNNTKPDNSTKTDSGAKPEGGTNGGPEEKRPGPLTAEELSACTDFLNRADVYGFLLSSYEDVLDADYWEVFYDGADVSETPDAKVLNLFLDAWGMNQPETDILCISAKNADQVLRERTGHSLRELDAHGNPFTSYFLPNLDGWFAHMHGDTHRFTVEAVSGRRNGDGTVTVESRERLWRGYASNGWPAVSPEYPLDPEDEPDSNTFSTILREREDGLPLIVSNTVTGGLLAWILENDDYMEPGVVPVEVTMERPPFDKHYLCPSLPETETAAPAALVLRSVADNGGTSGREWMAANWETWMADPRFAAEQEQDLHLLLDQDRRYAYLIDDDSFRGQGVSIYDNATQNPILFVDLFSYLFPDNASAAVSDGTDAQSLRWVRLLDGRLYFSNASSLRAERMGGHNAYLTAIDPWKGLLLWRTDPLVCGTANFAVPGPADGSAGVLLCGGEGEDGSGFLYQVGMKTGELLDRIPIDSVPEWIVCANDAAYVHCADLDYVFDVSY